MLGKSLFLNKLLEAGKNEGLKPRRGKIDEWTAKALFSKSDVLTGAQVNKRIKKVGEEMGFKKGKGPYGEVHVPGVNAYYDPSKHSVGVMSGFVHHDKNTKYNIPPGVIEHEVGHSRMAGKNNSKTKRVLNNTAYAAGTLGMMSPVLAAGALAGGKYHKLPGGVKRLNTIIKKGVRPATMAGSATVLGYEGDADRRVRDLYKKRGLSTKEANKKTLKELGPAYGSYALNAGIMSGVAHKIAKRMK